MPRTAPERPAGPAGPGRAGTRGVRAALLACAVLFTGVFLGSCAPGGSPDGGGVDAATGAGPLGDGARLLVWQAPEREPGPRVLTTAEREAVTDAYLRGPRETAFAAGTGQPGGLRDLFQGAALLDAQAAALGGAAPVGWAHAPTLRFYAPDGATVSFTDRFTYATPRPDPDAAPRVARRELDVVMELGDGNWRVHHWRVLRDEPLPAAPPPAQPAPYRAARAAPDWLQRTADTSRRSVSAVTELGLDTLIVPLAGGAAGPLNTGRAGQTGRALNVLLEAAAARNVTVLLDFQVAALDTAGLRDLHAALGPEPEGNPASVGTRLGGVILSPARSPSAAQLGAWRQTVRARFPALPVGYRAPGRSADATATRPVDFVAGSADAPVFRERRAPLGRLGDARRGWQLRAFLTRPGPLEAGVLGPDGGREGRGALLTADGSFTPLARWADPARPPPGPGAWLLGWAADLWTLPAGLLLGHALRGRLMRWGLPRWRGFRRCGGRP
ncbi:hypothetical protein Dcae01_01370 [Deinococcus caeni]|uniref:Uncharacterized protein n=1 Tax=Deinococcus caeni TaxID=569127 RepID=A0ABP9UBF1_9DEIO